MGGPGTPKTAASPPGIPRKQREATPTGWGIGCSKPSRPGLLGAEAAGNTEVAFLGFSSCDAFVFLGLASAFLNLETKDSTPFCPVQNTSNLQSTRLSFRGSQGARSVEHYKMLLSTGQRSPAGLRKRLLKFQHGVSLLIRGHCSTAPMRAFF